MKKILILLIIATFQVNANEQILKIKAVSISKKTFVVSMGAIDGIYKKQIATFYNKNFAAKAKALEVNRYNSLWKVRSKNLQIPFQTGEIVNYNTGSDSLLLNQKHIFISRLAKYENRNITFKSKTSWLFQTNITLGLNQKIDQVSSSSISNRSALTFELGKYYLYTPNFALSYSLLLTKSTLKQDSGLIIYTKRQMAKIRAFYLLNNNFNDKNKFFFSTSIAYGFSQTDVSSFKLTGFALSIPKISFGLIRNIGLKNKLIISLDLEQLSASETFSDGTTQGTFEQNVATSIGFLF